MTTREKRSNAPMAKRNINGGSKQAGSERVPEAPDSAGQSSPGDETRFPEWMTAWLFDSAGWHTRGDDLATNFFCSGAALAVSAVTGDRTGELTSRYTGLPLAFCYIVFGMMDRDSLWDSIGFSDLVLTLRTHPSDAQDALECALEEYWMESQIFEASRFLNHHRARRLVGGHVQDWLDPETESGEAALRAELAETCELPPLLMN